MWHNCKNPKASLKPLLPPHLHKVPRVHLFQRDLQVKDDVVSSGDVPVLLLPVSSKHEPKVSKEAADEGRKDKEETTCVNIQSFRFVLQQIFNNYSKDTDNHVEKQTNT